LKGKIRAGEGRRKGKRGEIPVFLFAVVVIDVWTSDGQLTKKIN